MDDKIRIDGERKAHTFKYIKEMIQAQFVKLVEEFKNERIRTQSARSPQNGAAVQDKWEKWELREIQEFRRKLSLLKQNKQRVIKERRVNV